MQKSVLVCMNRKIPILINGALVVLVVVHLTETEKEETTSMARIGLLHSDSRDHKYVNPTD